MKEKIINLFLIIEEGIIVKIGAKCHIQYGSDSQKTIFLKQSVESDFKDMEFFRLPSKFIYTDSTGKTETGKIRYESFLALSSCAKHLEIFEPVFQYYRLSRNPLFCITPVVNGKITIQGKLDF